MLIAPAYSNTLWGVKWWDRNEKEHSSPFSLGNIVLYPFWVVLGLIFVPLGPNFGVTDNWECLKLL